MNSNPKRRSPRKPLKSPKRRSPRKSPKRRSPRN